MLSAAIFQPEITTLESQIAQLKTQIAQAEQRIVNLSEVESIEPIWDLLMSQPL